MLPEHFQRLNHQRLGHLDGIVCQIDDILVLDKAQKKPDRSLREVLGRVKEKGIAANREKCVFSLKTSKFQGYDQQNCCHRRQGGDSNHRRYSYANKLRRTQEFPGNGGFHRTVHTEPGDQNRTLERSDSQGCFSQLGQHEQLGFEHIKKRLTSRPVVALYCPTKETVL